MGGIRAKHSHKSRRNSSSVYEKMGGRGRGGTLNCIWLSPFLRHASFPDGVRASGKTVAYPYQPHTSDRRTDQGDGSGWWDALGWMRPLQQDGIRNGL